MSLIRLREAQPRLGVILGSGLGAVAESLGIETVVPYIDVPGMPVSTVPGHAGRFALVNVGGTPVLIAQGRSHLYEGLSAAQVTFPVRIMHELGVRTLVLTNAAGALNPNHAVGELMMITDHLNLTGTSPLIGGPHFHDMTEVYAPRLRTTLRSTAQEHAISLHEGVYAGLIGPQYETPAEIRMLRTLGADAVGMSTVLEAIQARALSMEVAGISTLTNWAAGISSSPLNHEEVMATGKAVVSQLATLIRGLASS